MKKGLVPGIFLVISLLGAYAWWEYNRKTDATAWDLVPSQALTAFHHTSRTPADPAPALLKAFFTDSLTQQILSRQDLIASVHVVSQHELGFVLYVPHGEEIEKALVAQWTKNHSLHERTLSGFSIREGNFTGRKMLTTATYKNILVISSASWLTEEVIRRAHAEDQPTFTRHHRTVFQMAKETGDSSTFYADLSQLAKALNVFQTEKPDNPAINAFGKSLRIDLRREKESLILSGFANDTLSGKPAFLSTFNRQHPVPLTIQKVVSNRTGLLIDFGMSDFSVWNEDRLTFCATYNKALPDSLIALSKEHHFDTKLFYQNLGDEAGLCHSGVFTGEVLLVAVKDPGRIESMMEKFDRHRGSDQLPTETFSHYRIHFLGLPTLPRTLFWPLISEKMGYYALIENHLVMTEKLDDLKAFLSDLDAESTWGKSTAWNDFLTTSQDTNVGVIFDVSNWWPGLSNELTPFWQNAFDSVRLENVDKGSLQLSRLEKSYYFNGILKFGKKGGRPKAEGLLRSLEIELKDQVVAGPVLVRNHNSGKEELLLQDGHQALQLYSASLKNIFSTDIDRAVQSDFYQIDFLKNKKLQYLFATDKKLHLIDRLGNPVKGFPVSLSEGIQFLTVLDYDNNRNYRYLITDRQGVLTLLDREGKVLPDWKPFTIKSTPWVAPRAVRDNGKDYLIVITTDGVVYSLTRKGDIMDGFPVTLKIRPVGDWFFDQSGEHGIIHLVNAEGLLVQLDLKGKVISQSNMPRSSTNSVFSLARSSDGSRYVISRMDRSHIAVLNGQGEVLWDRENPGSEQMVLTYEALGHGRSYFSFTDSQQEFVHVFDEKGIPVFPRPLESKRPPVVMIEKGDAAFYCTGGTLIRVYRPGKVR